MEHSFVYNTISNHLEKRDSQPAREFAQWAGDYAQKLRHFEQDARSRKKGR